MAGVEGKWATQEELQRMTKREILLELARRSEDHMAAIDDLRAAVSGLQTQADSEHAELGDVVAQLSTVTGQLEQLQTQASQGGGVSEADIESVATTVQGIADAAATAVQNAKASVAATGGGGGAAPTAAPTAVAPVDVTSPPPDPNAPAPTDGGTVAPTDGGTQPATPDPGTPVDPATGQPVVTDPSASPTAGGPTDPVSTDPTGGVQVNERTVYVLGEGVDPATVDPTTWPAAPVETDDDPPRQLYYFAGDTEPGQENGAGVAGFEVYSGTTQGTVAAGAGDPSVATTPDAGSAGGDAGTAGGAAPGEA